MAAVARHWRTRATADMPQVVWSRAALRDLDRVLSFLADHSEPAAKRAAKMIDEATQLLTTHPEAGRPALDMPVEFREWVVKFGRGAYLIFYSFSDGNVVILALRHSRELGYSVRLPFPDL